jgi:hypothetical protein
MAEEKPVKKSKSWRAGFLAGVASVGMVGGSAVGVNMRNEATAIADAAHPPVSQQSSRYNPLRYIEAGDSVILNARLKSNNELLMVMRIPADSTGLLDVVARIQPSENPNKGK